MVKKMNFKGSLNDIINEMKDETPQVEERPKSARGLRPGLNRFSIVLPVGLMDDLRAVAYWNKMTVKDVIVQFLDSSMEKYKEIHGDVLPIPTQEKKLL